MSQDEASRPRPGRPPWALLAVVALVGLASLPRYEYVGDPFATRLEAIHLLQTGQLGVPPEIGSRMGMRGQYFFENVEKGRWFSKFGVLNTLLAVPALALERAVTGVLPLVSPRRLHFLNAMNVVWTLVTTAYLVATVGLYTGDRAARWVFVLSAFYATYWWNYLRGHTSEIHQTVFFIAYYFHLVSFIRRRPRPRAHLLGASLFLSALCLTKLSYLILVPVAAIALLASEREAKAAGQPKGPGWWKDVALGFGVPSACLLVLIAALNQYRFGGPLVTGYQQLASMRDVLGGDLGTALRGYLWSAEGSVFTHFPLFLFALPGYPRLFRKHPAEGATIVVMLAAVVLLNGRYLHWQGAPCYGPRYLLPVLPIASLPFVEGLAWIRGHVRTAAGMAAAVVMAFVLVVSAWLQHAVNTLPFFAYDLTRNVARARHPDGEAVEAFYDRHVGYVHRDLIRYRRGEAPLPLLESARPRMDPAAFAAFERGIAGFVRSNYFWFDPLKNSSKYVNPSTRANGRSAPSRPT